MIDSKRVKMGPGPKLESLMGEVMELVCTHATRSDGQAIAVLSVLLDNNIHLKTFIKWNKRKRRWFCRLSDDYKGSRGSAYGTTVAMAISLSMLRLHGVQASEKVPDVRNHPALSAL